MKLTIEPDEDDAAAIHHAIAVHQSERVNGEHVLPEGESDIAAAVLGEICRDWGEYRDGWGHQFAVEQRLEAAIAECRRVVSLPADDRWAQAQHSLANRLLKLMVAPPGAGGKG